MPKHTHSPENTKSSNDKKVSGWKKVTAAAALGLALTACDDMPNNEIRLNPEDQSARFKIEYQYSMGSAGYDIVNYDITVSKQGDTYMGLINEKNGWKSKKTKIESDNVDEVFDGISRALDSDQIKDQTTFNKNKKINFVEKEYKDKIVNAENSANIDEIKIKYKPE